MHVMNFRDRIAMSLVVVGITAIVVCQILNQNDDGGRPASRQQGILQEHGSTHPTQRPHFTVVGIKTVKTEETSKGVSRTISVQMKNELDRKITILGGNNSCRRWGCYEALKLPLTFGPGETAAFEVLALWTEFPEKPLVLRLFTDLSLDAVIDIEVMPDAVTIVQEESARTAAKQGD